MRKNASPITRISSDDLRELVGKSSSYTDILLSLGLPNKGNTTNILKKRLEAESISTDHLKQNHRLRSIANLKTDKTPLSEILVENSTYSRVHLKARLIKDKILEEKCSSCGISTWLGQVLSLDLHHINGISNDNRLENLCLLCPNCHRLTDTYAGKRRV